MTFVRNHAQDILACDFIGTATASFQLLYVFVVMEVGTRRIALSKNTSLAAGEFRQGLRRSGEGFNVHVIAELT
jgi:hypothetical protein